MEEGVEKGVEKEDDGGLGEGVEGGVERRARRSDHKKHQFQRSHRCVVMVVAPCGSVVGVEVFVAVDVVRNIIFIVVVVFDEDWGFVVVGSASIGRRNSQVDDVMKGTLASGSGVTW